MDFHAECRCAEVWSVKQQIEAKVTVIAHLICEVRTLKKSKPEHRISHPLNAGGILNAYREGDIDFETAVREIQALQPEISTLCP